MIYNDYYYLDYLIPKIPTLNEKPPTVYSLLESIVNYGKDDKQKIKDLAKYGRSTFFDFSYPLTSNISKEDFECMILNHYLMRRIGFETLTAFKIQLNVKLNEIMPIYNKLFDSLQNWDLFRDGETTTRTKETESTGSENSNKNSTTQNAVNSSSSNSVTNTAENSTDTTQDRRQSDTPQSQLSNIQNASYVTDYEYNTNNTTSEDSSSSTGTSTTNTTNNTSTQETNNATDSNNTNENETIIRTQHDKIAIYKEFQNSIKSIYSMIFNDLDCLFYGLL